MNVYTLQYVFWATMVLASMPMARAISIGSNGPSASRQPRAVFAKAETDNTMLGFGIFENGFALATDLTGATDVSTTCTFDDFFPVSGQINLGGGKLYLSQDFYCSNDGVFTNAGAIFANNRAVILEFDPLVYSMPSTGTYGRFSFKRPGEVGLQAIVNSVSWAHNSAYVASCSQSTGDSNPELNIFYFDGANITTTKTFNDSRVWHKVAWHPSALFLAAGRDASGSHNLKIFKLNTSNGALTIPDSETFSSANVFSVAWHPSGNYLFVGKDNGDSGHEVRLYSFSTGAGTLTSLTSVDISPSRAPRPHASCWAPGGARLAVGTAVSGTSPELLVYTFNGTSLTLTSSMTVGSQVNALDWNPTGSYVAVGLNGVSQSLRIYQHTMPSNTLIEQQTARNGIARVVNSVHWHPSGDYLYVSYNGPARPQISVYYFDRTALTLTELGANMTQASNNADNNDARFSPNGLYAVRGDDNCVVTFYRLKTDTFFRIDNGTLVLNSDLDLHVDMHFSGNCAIRANGAAITLRSGAQFIVRPGGSLRIEEACLTNVGGSNVRCMTDAGQIIVQDSVLRLTSGYTFSRGSMLFQGDVAFTGTGSFGYNTRLSSTIDQFSTLLFDQGCTFTYAPARAKSDLLQFVDETATLYLNGSSLHSTRTGISLSDGTLLIDNLVTMSSAARSRAEGMALKDNLAIKVLSNGQLDLFGHVRYGA